MAVSLIRGTLCYYYTSQCCCALGSDAHFHQLAHAASALASASTTPAASALTPTARAASSCPLPSTADAHSIAALPAPSTQPTRLRLPSPAQRSPGDWSLFLGGSGPHTLVMNTRGAAGRVAFCLL
eukprot:6207757-Pleurochrysis_carterae.AAC.1